MAPKSGSKAAKRGFDSEEEFKKLIDSNSNFNLSLCQKIGASQIISSVVTKDNKLKGDIRLQTNKGIILLSIKTAEANFNQLDRRWLIDLAQKHKMPNDIFEQFVECLAEKTNKPKGLFILKKYEHNILTYLKNNLKSILKDVFTRDDTNLKFFVVYDYSHKAWFIAPIEDIIDEVSNSTLITSKKGVVYIGDYVSLQRKGGNGKHIKIPKSDPKHPGNQLQFKIKPISLLGTGLFVKI